MAKAKKYNVLIGCERDPKGKDPGARFEPGDTVTEADFPAKVIKGWVEKGVLELVKGGRSSGR